jgi:signal transduction histidine kinase
MGLLLREIVSLREQAPRFDRIFLTALLLVATLGLLAVPLGLSDILKPWLWKLFLLEMIVNIGVAVWLATRGNRAARFYLMAFGVLLLGGVFSILGNLGWLPDPALGHIMPLVGTILHMVLMQMTVNDRVLAAKRAYDQAREQALAAEKRATEGLNREVAQRTEALENALASEQRVVEQQKMFVRLISHEFRTPLAVIDASARSMSLLPSLPEDAASRCSNIRQATHRLSALLEKCVAESRLEAEQGPDLQPMQVANLIKVLQDQLALEAPGRAVQFHAPVADATLQGDPLLLQIMFGNLLSNALKYSPEDSTVRMDFIPEAGRMRIRVSDYGSGIPADELPRVFDKFMRGSHPEQTTGLGLGLPLARKIAELHGATIDIDSQPGQGTRVSVLMPAGDGQDIQQRP